MLKSCVVYFEVIPGRTECVIKCASTEHTFNRLGGTFHVTVQWGINLRGWNFENKLFTYSATCMRGFKVIEA